MTYHIGQRIPLDYTRSIIGSEMACPQWFALCTPPQKERAVREALRIRGIHACYPEREVSYIVRGKRHQRKFPIITRVVYAKFRRQPQWDVLKARKLITGVFGHGETPIVIPSDVIRGVMGLPTKAEELEAARRELLRVREGDRATLASGPLSGLLVDVTTVAEGRVWFETLTGMKGETTMDSVERVIPVEKPGTFR